jgi:DNA-binding phage protein
MITVAKSLSAIKLRSIFIPNEELAEVIEPTARTSQCKALLGEGNPSFATILKVTHALGLAVHGGVRQA